MWMPSDAGDHNHTEGGTRASNSIGRCALRATSRAISGVRAGSSWCSVSVAKLERRFDCAATEQAGPVCPLVDRGLGGFDRRKRADVVG